MHFPLIFQEELEEDWINYELANYFVLSINTFTCLSSPINLSVYCGMSKQFRDELRHIMTRYIKDISFRLMIMIVLVIISCEGAAQHLHLCSVCPSVRTSEN